MIERIIAALGEYLEWITIPPDGLADIDAGTLIRDDAGAIYIAGDVRTGWPVDTTGCGCCSYGINATEYASIPDAIERIKQALTGGN